MQDRVQTKPNRYAVYDDNHNFLRYEYHERADEPTQAGTPINKETLLKDITSELLGISLLSTPDDALAAAYLKAVGKCQVFITALLPNGRPAANTNISGLTGATNTVTDANGKLSALVSATSVSAYISGYIDLDATPTIINTPIGTRVYATLTSTFASVKEKKILASASNLLFSELVDTVDVFCVGAGAGGGGAKAGMGPSGGGGGGYTAFALNIPRKSTPENAVVGAGGNGGRGGSEGSSSKGSDGGTTSFYGVTANGGKGGLKNYEVTQWGGDGGSGGAGYDALGGTDGADGATTMSSRMSGKGQGKTTRAFGESTGELFATGGRSGVPGGGSGSGSIASNNTGNGGGGASSEDGYNYDGGRGGSGVIIVRWRNKVA